MELIPCVDLILQMEPIPVVELIPVNDMIPTFMILIPTYPHCGIGDSNSNSKKYWNITPLPMIGQKSRPDGVGLEILDWWQL